jgi:hypothetical protein
MFDRKVSGRLASPGARISGILIKDSANTFGVFAMLMASVTHSNVESPAPFRRPIHRPHRASARLAQAAPQ